MKLDEEGIGSGTPSLPTLVLESGLAIVAGNQCVLSAATDDVNVTALSNIFFYIIQSRYFISSLEGS